MSTTKPITVAPPLKEPYHYVPTEYVCAIFVALYAISTLSHLIQSIKYRTWWLLPTVVLAGVAEIVGWSARLWSSTSPHILIPYEIQLTCTIIAPTPLVAANFIIIGKIISRLVCLVVQAVGGATAATAVAKLKPASNGGNIMLGGIVAQMVAIVIYVACAGEFFLRYFADAPIRKAHQQSSGKPDQNPAIDRKMKLMIIALIFDTTCIFIRSVYRTIELSDGWAGRIISTQVYFNVLDGAMITLAIVTLNFAHPGALLVPPTTPVKTMEDYISQDADEPAPSTV